MNVGERCHRLPAARLWLEWKVAQSKQGEQQLPQCAHLGRTQANAYESVLDLRMRRRIVDANNRCRAGSIEVAELCRCRS